ncbi:MAG: precorrin-6y C5,15-methyltransferase (decarboxylating) subunit CbiE [Pirellulaceae bacterium]|nr:precorrin-6y C5,15-methyltransferase (decarboxylating) subunit CbiE [Pirellulaceae bacterium]
MPDKITIIGVSDDGLEGLTRQARELLTNAATLVGPAGLVAKMAHEGQTQVALSANLEQAAKTFEGGLKGPVVMLASGDPLFYGTARFLCDRLGKERFEVLPHVSSMQLAFARVKESWDEAYLTNLATQSLDRVVERVRSAEKVGVFTTEETPPKALAKAMVDKGIEYFTLYVCENLGSRDERVTRGKPSEILRQDFSPLNVVVLVRDANVPDRPADMIGKRLFGNPDEMFLQSRPKRGLLTPSEVRAIALCEMDLGPQSIVWDVGAGSGSVAIEAARIASGGRVFAIEMDAEDYNLLIENSRRFGTANLTPILGEAPGAWVDLPDPDAMFIGGTGRSVTQLIEVGWPRLRHGGRMVINIASMENLVMAQRLLQKMSVEVHVLMINLARSTQQLDELRLDAANPSFLLMARRS